MTKQHTLKRLIRARMSETGETYSTARRHFRVYERKHTMSQELIDRCARGDLDNVKSLLSEGADVNYRGNHGNTPLAFSAFIGHLDLINLLMDAGADPNSPGYEESVPVGLAAYEGHDDAVRLLLERGANPNIANATTGVTTNNDMTLRSDLPDAQTC